MTPATPGLAGFERRHLRALAHPLKPVVQVGQAGLTDAVVAAVEVALLTHELIKVRLLKPDAKQEQASELAGRSGAQLVGLVGHTAILYRPHPDEPKIVLPRRA
jgi:RNA-binding protein